MPLVAILAFAAGTLALRVGGPLLGRRMRVPERVERLVPVTTAVLLIALMATSTLTEGQGFAGWARPAGVLVAGILVLRRAPFPVVVIAAAATTAGLRLCGVS